MIPQCRILKIEDHEDIVHLTDMQSEGAEGYVTAAVYRGGPVAVKKYKNRPNLWASIQREVAVMTLMDSSPHIVKLVGVFETLPSGNKANVQASIVMDFAYNQNLAGLLAATSRGAVLSLELRRRIVYDVCRGLRDLHAQGIAHEDLKCENVLLDFGLRARLCDFGLSAHIESPFDDRSSGTAGWRAPEKDTFCQILCRSRGPGRSSEEHVDQLISPGADVLQAAGYDRLKSDIYSLGLVIQQVFDGAGDEACSSISAIVQDCLSSDPDARPSCERLIEKFKPARLPYSLFTGVEEKSLENEVGRLNVCYNWTGFDDDEPDAVKQVRNFIFLKKYSQALDLLHSEASFAEEDSRPAFLRNVFLGVLSFHGCGCEVDLDKANEWLRMAKEDAEADTREIFLVDFYLAAVMLAKDDPASVGTLLQLSRKGNALATAQLACIQSAKGSSVTRYMSISQAGELELLDRAARAGHSHAQAQLSLLFLNKVHQHAVVAERVLQGDQGSNFYPEIPNSVTIPKDTQAATSSIQRGTADLPWIAQEALLAAEGGSILGQLIWEVLTDEDLLLNREAQELAENYPVVCEFLGRLYFMMRDSTKALFWFTKARLERGIVACLIDSGLCAFDMPFLVSKLCMLAVREDDMPGSAAYLSLPIEQFVHARLLLARIYILTRQMDYAYYSIMACKKEDIYALNYLLSLEQHWLAAGGSDELMRDKRGMLSAEAVWYVAIRYGDAGQRVKALEWHVAAADKGSTDAMIAIFRHFSREGQFEEARKWLEKAVYEVESPFAMGLLSAALFEGDAKWCSTKNEELAKRLSQGAVNKNPNMAYIKAMLGVVQLDFNPTKAVNLLMESGQLGFPPAIKELACFYQRRGSPGDLTRLRHWYTTFLRLLCTEAQLSSGIFLTARDALQFVGSFSTHPCRNTELTQTCLEEERRDAAYMYKRYLEATGDDGADKIVELWCAQLRQNLPEVF